MSAILQVFLIFILPVILAYLGIIPIKFRLWLFFILVVVVSFLSRYEQFTLQELGIRFDNFDESIIPYSSLTLAGIILLIGIAKLLHKKVHPNWWRNPHFQFMFIILSVTQEFMYRGYLMPKLMEINPSVIFVVVANSLIFMFLHIIYPNKISNLSFTFIGGLAFALVYYYYPNLILISISHALLNFFAVLYGLVGFGRAKKLNEVRQKK